MQQVHEGLEISKNDWRGFLEVVGEVAVLTEIGNTVLGELQLLFDKIKLTVIEI